MSENSLTKQSGEGQRRDCSNSSKGFILPADFPLLAPPPIREIPALSINTPDASSTKNTQGNQPPRGITVVPKITSMESAFTLAGLSVPRFESQAEYLVHLKNKLERVQKSRPKEERKDKYNINDHIIQTHRIAEAALVSENEEDVFAIVASMSLQESRKKEVADVKSSLLDPKLHTPSDTNRTIQIDETQQIPEKSPQPDETLLFTTSQAQTTPVVLTSVKTNSQTDSFADFDAKFDDEP